MKVRGQACVSLLTPALVATQLCLGLAAQATLTVGPGGYAQISDAVSAAQPGDLILVQSGAYLPFNLPIGVRIVAPQGATVTTPPGGGGLPWSHTFNPPTGQQAAIVGLNYATNTAYPPAEPPVTVIVSGNVVFTNCQFFNFSDYASSAVVCNGNADVQFDRCQFSSPWDCLSVGSGRVAATNCQFTGYNVLWGAGPASGIVAGGGDITLFSCNVLGSPGNSSNPTGTPGIRLSGTARLRVIDSTVTCGNPWSMAGAGIVNNTTNPVEYARSAITGSYGIISWNPLTAGQGPPVSGPSQELMLVGGSAPTRPMVGVGFAGSITGPENSLAGTVLSLERAPATVVPFAAQPIHFDPATAVVFDVGFTGVSTTWPGSGTYSWQTVPLDVSLSGLQFFLHSLLWDGTTFQVGPVFGGILY
ncbi:MAG: hypothetical protein JNK78_18120 [Planctomycetes bacterium]|nr:hypothetical protein [Planctomycetota bacterium]